jgi:hypothetical protein
MRLILLSLVLFLSSSQLFADDTWQNVKKGYEDLRDGFRANYATDLRSAHRESTRAHFQLTQVDAMAAFSFLHESAIVEGQKFRLAYLQFVQDSLDDSQDPLVLLSLFNRGQSHLSEAREASLRLAEIENEMKELQQVVAQFCSPSFLDWPQTYFNAQTMFPPPYVSITEEPQFGVDFGVSVSYTVSYGGGQSSSGVDVGFEVNAESETEEAIRGGLMAGGCVAGSMIGAHVGCAVGSVAGALAFSIGKFFYDSFSQMGEIFAYNETLGILNEINQILAGATPQRSFSDGVVSEVCLEVLVDGASDQPDLATVWAGSFLEVQSLVPIQNDVLAQLNSVQEMRFQAVQNLFEDQASIARSTSFPLIGAERLAGEFDDFRAWNDRVRTLYSELLARSHRPSKSDVQNSAEEFFESEILFNEAQTLLSPKNDSSFRQKKQIESKPLWKMMEGLSQKFNLKRGGTEP